jgi:predicted enzyme related to lactoylglutathione lyase
MQSPLVHLELHTGNLARACAFYSALLGWRAETVRADGCAYVALALGVVGGGVVEHEADGAAWLPYVEVADVAASTELARALGAHVLLEPREGPAGWRSVVSVPAGAQIALWQPKLP